MKSKQGRDELLRALPVKWGFWILNRVFNRYTGEETRPVFFPIDTTWPSLNNLTSRFADIKQEVEALLELTKGHLPRYHDLDPTQESISSGEPGREWKVFMLCAHGEHFHQNCALSPKTSALVDSVPGVRQAFFSILEPGKEIPPHKGGYRGHLRYHLALIVPKDNPPQIRVKDQFYTWREREAVLFDDTWEHQIYNKSTGIRVVLIVDILRPMPILPHALNKAFVETVGRHYYGRKMLENLQ